MTQFKSGKNDWQHCINSHFVIAPRNTRGRALELAAAKNPKQNKPLFQFLTAVHTHVSALKQNLSDITNNPCRRTKRTCWRYYSNSRYLLDLPALLIQTRQVCGGKRPNLKQRREDLCRISRQTSASDSLRPPLRAVGIDGVFRTVRALFSCYRGFARLILHSPIQQALAVR